MGKSTVWPFILGYADSERNDKRLLVLFRTSSLADLSLRMMFRKLMTGLLILINYSLQAQDTLYFNDHWDVCKKKQATYYRVRQQLDAGGYLASDYFLDGTLQMQGTFAADDMREGLFTYYYKNGNKDASGYYLHNFKEGDWIQYYENGQIHSTGSYSRGFEEKNWKYYYDSGELRVDKNMHQGKHEGSFTSYFKNGQLHRQLYYKQDTLAGNKKTYYENGKPHRDEVYENGNRVKAACYDSLGNEVPFYEYMQVPAFKFGGEEGLIQFLAKNIHYTKKARRKNIEGRVVVYFAIEKDGSLSSVKLLHPVDPLLDDEVLRVIKLTQWDAGKVDGEPEVLDFTLPVDFQLSE